jgi:AMIN domain
MKFQPCVRSALVALALLTGLLIASGRAQSTPKLLATTDTPILVRSVRVLPGPAVEILSSRPLVPAISTLDNPPRLVIDLPNADLPANLSGNNNRIDASAQEIRRVRVNQYQNAPPVTRVVVDLVKPVGHTWDAAGNRLMVRLRASSDQVTAKPPSVPAFTQGIQPAAVPLGPGSSGTVVLAGSRAAAGSSVTAGSETSVLRLQRGGEVLVCPGTTVSVTSSQNGNTLMLGMNTGALEAHYKLDASADSILTPDFRILLAGPGEFHYAISADSRGNTCVRALSGNTASVIVSELLGEGNYQVKPTEQIVFHSGRLNLVDAAVPASCGCPPPEIPVMRASAAPVLSDAKQPSSSSMDLAQAKDGFKPVTPAASGRPSNVTLPGEAAALPPETAALPPSKPNDIHVQVDAPFVFRAADMPANNPPAPKPAPIPDVQSLPVRDLPRPATFETEVLPPGETQGKTAHHGAFAKIKGFFSAIFG